MRLLTVLCAVVLVACTKTPPTTVCTSSHDVHSAYQLPIQVGCAAYSSNICTVPIWTYIDEDEVDTVCDSSRPITASELAAWHKEND